MPLEIALSDHLKAMGNLVEETIADPQLTVTGVACDSRSVKPGMAFVAIQGATVDGRDFIDQAIENGASVVVMKGDIPVSGPVVRVRDDYRALGIMAEVDAGFPTRDMVCIGITGTNGKTTTAFQMMEILRRAGRKPGLIGTVSYDLGGEVVIADRTTPTPTGLQSLLARMRDNGVDTLVIEVSSHALVQGRIGSMAFDAAIFCNQTPEHLDYHLTMEAYFQAKKRLFSDHLKPDGVGIVNGDDAFGKRLRDELTCRVQSFGSDSSADLTLTTCDLGIGGSTFSLNGSPLSSPLVGRYNVENVMGAYLAAYSLGVGLTAVREGIEKFDGVPGRLQRIVNDCGFDVFVDYAHTGDALEKVLKCMRPLCSNRLIVVAGCGGDRDRSKRPVMGAVAASIADTAIITSDNPRTENPQSIIDDIMVGIPENANYVVEVDRRRALELVIHMAQPGDAVLVAGKGHEDYQEINGVKHPFDDAIILSELLASGVKQSE
jgi:UDP-N-acetylmuramoyl-L-alanyl-D-glutamate--2,6-diaminopimelate ligase